MKRVWGERNVEYPMFNLILQLETIFLDGEIPFMNDERRDLPARSRSGEGRKGRWQTFSTSC